MTVISHMRNEIPTSPETLVSPPCRSGSMWTCASGISTSSCSGGSTDHMAALSLPYKMAVSAGSSPPMTAEMSIGDILMR